MYIKRIEEQFYEVLDPFYRYLYLFIFLVFGMDLIFEFSVVKIYISSGF